MSKNKTQGKINIQNKKAYFEYEITEKFTAGIVLTGTEIKSIRQGKASLNEAYCKFFDNELYVLMHISEYDHGGIFNHEPDRKRKLLLNKRELKRIKKKVEESGYTVVPLDMFLNENGYVKLTIALAKGKKLYEKRNTIKEKDIERETSRELKNRKQN